MFATASSPASSTCSTTARSWSAADRRGQPHHPRAARRLPPRLIEAEPDIGEIIMRAFILRRVGLMRIRRAGWC
jgi:hypothetical protein